MLLALTAAPRDARANSILETIGIGIAVGTVLGASTLPFYDQPGKHVSNLAYGAAAGVVVGLVYGVAAGRSSYDQANNADYDQGDPGPGPAPALVSTLPNTPARFWMPLVSLNW